MPKVYREKTDLEKALKCYETETGHKPNCHDLAALFNDSPNVWGRIIKGLGVPHGEYLAKINLLKEHGTYAVKLWAYAEKSQKYGQRTRKGKIAPHTKHVYRDQENFMMEKIIESRMSEFDNPDDIRDEYYNQVEQLRNEGPFHFSSYEDQQTALRDFYNSLQ
jgi:hypothetical protein